MDDSSAKGLPVALKAIAHLFSVEAEDSRISEEVLRLCRSPRKPWLPVVSLLLPYVLFKTPESGMLAVEALCESGISEAKRIAADAIVRLLKRDFGSGARLLGRLAESGAPALRSLVPVTCARVLDSVSRSQALELLRLAATLAGDPEPQVRLALGPNAIRGGFYRRYPEETMNLLENWANSENACTRWNCVMVFAKMKTRQDMRNWQRLAGHFTNERNPMVRLALTRVEISHRELLGSGRRSRRPAAS